MAEQFGTMLTSIGKAKIANSIGFGTKINFTKFKLGDGGGSYYTPTEDQEDLKHVVYEGNITYITTNPKNSNQIIIKLSLPASVGGFFIREYGVFDDDGDMIAICKCSETYKPTLEEGAVKELAFNMILTISNINSIQLKIDKTLVFVTKEEIDPVIEEIFPDNEVITINHGFKGYPSVRIIATNYGAGIGGAGETPAGGTESYSVECKTCFLDRDNIKIYVPQNYFSKSPHLEKNNDNQYIITFDNSTLSLIIDLINI